MDLSVIIPAYNEAEFIEKCCSAVHDQLKISGLSYEVILVDNGSTDDTVSTASKFQPISVFSINRSSVSTARNFGYEKSSGRILAFIDADVVITGTWVEEIKKQLQEIFSRPVVTGCQYSIRKDPSWIESNWFSCINSNHINGGNLIVSKSAFEYLGGFNDKLKTGEDVEFCNRSKNHNEILYKQNEGFVAVHLGYPRDLAHFVRREAWHGEGDFSSLRYFISSKVAIISVFYFVSQISVVFLFVFGFYDYFIVSVILIFVFNMLITIYRFGPSNCNGLLPKSFLNYLYFTARFWSLFQAFQKRRKSY